MNNAVIPGKASPQEYVAEITRANDGVVNQRTIYQTASRGYDMVRRLERYGVKFAKDAAGDYDVRRVHRSGSYVLPMPEGKDIKKVLYRVLRQRSIRERVRIENRVMPVRVLTAAGRAAGLAGFNTRTGAFVTVSAGAVILATGACGRLGLPASGYLYGTYENPTNAGDGHAMAYHAGAELSGLECFQVAAGLRELAEVLPAGEEALTHNLRSRLDSPDPVVRCAVLDVLREIRAGTAGVFAAALADDDHRVRLCAVRGLVSVGKSGLVAQAAGDQSREVRVGVADGLALMRQGEQVLERLAGDPDPLVRAAAFKAAGAVGCPPPLDAHAIRALADNAWQARAGAAQALAAADPAIAVAPLARAAADPHPEVRKAAVIALASMRTDRAAAGALRAAADDSDADVRAYARQAALP